MAAATETRPLQIGDWIDTSLGKAKVVNIDRSFYAETVLHVLIPPFSPAGDAAEGPPDDRAAEGP